MYIYVVYLDVLEMTRKLTTSLEKEDKLCRGKLKFFSLKKAECFLVYNVMSCF